MSDNITLEKLLANVFQAGCTELVLRVARYDLSNGMSSIRPVSFQAIVRYLDATRPWAVKVDDNCFDALLNVLAMAIEQQGSRVDDRQPEHKTKTNDSAGPLRQAAIRRIVRFPNFARKKTGNPARTTGKREKPD
jgi:hypothetical protein